MFQQEDIMTGRRYVAGGKVAKSTPIRIRGLAVNCIKQQLCAVPVTQKNSLKLVNFAANN